MIKREKLLISYSPVKFKFWPLFGLAVIIAMAAGPSAQRGSPAVPSVRTVYVTAVDRKEVPVGDLTAKEFILREGGDVREIIKIEPATAPLHIAIIVDDSGTGIFRVPVANFVNQLLGRRSSPLNMSSDRPSGSSITRQMCSGCAMPFCSSAYGPRHPKADASSKRCSTSRKNCAISIGLSSSCSRHARVVQRLPAHHVMEELQRSGAILQVIAVHRAAQLNPSSVPIAKDKPADLLEHQLDINRVLGDGPKQTGGRRVEIGGLGGPFPSFRRSPRS